MMASLLYIPSNANYIYRVKIFVHKNPVGIHALDAT